MFNKKGDLELKYIVVFVILLIVAGIIIYTFTSKFSEGSSGISDHTSNRDKDLDGIPDSVDPCKGENPIYGSDAWDSSPNGNCPGPGKWE